MYRAYLALLVATITACKGSETSSPSVSTLSGSVEVSRVKAPVVVSGPVDTRITSSEPLPIASVASPVAVSGIASPVPVSGIASPVAVSGIASAVAVSGVAAPVEVSAIAAPVKVAEIQAPVTVQLARAELDPARIETGSENSGSATTCYSNAPCRKLIDGPFILTDLVFWQTYSTIRGDGRLYVRAGDPASTYTSRWLLSLSSSDEGSSSSTYGSVGNSYASLTTHSTTTSTRREVMTGARLAVRGGEALYYEGSNTSLLWSGFRP